MDTSDQRALRQNEKGTHYLNFQPDLRATIPMPGDHMQERPGLLHQALVACWHIDTRSKPRSALPTSASLSAQVNLGSQNTVANRQTLR